MNDVFNSYDFKYKIGTLRHKGSYTPTKGNHLIFQLSAEKSLKFNSKVENENELALAHKQVKMARFLVVSTGEGP